MGIRDAIAHGPSRQQKGAVCQTCKWLEKLDPELREGAQMLLASPNEEWSTAELLRQFSDDGLNVSHTTLGRHRNGECSAGRQARRGDS